MMKHRGESIGYFIGKMRRAKALPQDMKALRADGEPALAGFHELSQGFIPCGFISHGVIEPNNGFISRGGIERGVIEPDNGFISHSHSHGMIEPDNGFIPRGIVEPLKPLSWLYRAAIFARNKAYDAGMFRSRKLPVPVISIGNISTGGTGKTPAAMALALEASARGLRPVILTRGYGGRAKGAVIVSDGKKVFLDAIQAGEEAFLMASRLPGVPVVKSPKRFDGGMLAVERFNPGMIILDDGFQHRALARDVDIVLIDGSSPLADECLLPAGRLREPVSSLRRASEIVIAKADIAARENTTAFLRRQGISAPISALDYRPVDLLSCSGKTMPLSAIDGGRILAFSGIANPEHFRRSLVELGADVLKFIPFRDHYRYSADNVRAIRNQADRLGAEMVVTTEKDLVKMPEPGFWALAIRVAFEKDMMDRVFSICRRG